MRKVFAVDDDTEMLDLMSDMLSPLGCAMASATRCKGSIDKMRQYVPDAILLDVMLPDGSGYEISRSVRADSALYKTPILFISAIADAPEVEYALSQGCDAYLHKPFTMSDLTSRFHELSALMNRINQPSVETGFMTLEAIMREIDHRVFQQRAFSLCYMSIDDFDAYHDVNGQDKAATLIAHAAATIRQVLGTQGLQKAAIAHLGREYFLALLPVAAYSGFCAQVESDFRGTGRNNMSLRMDISVRNDYQMGNTRNLLHELQSAHKKKEGGQQKTLFRWSLHRDW